MGLKKKLTKENMKGMSEYAKEKLYQKAADKYGIKYESKSVGGRPGESNEKPGMGAKHAVNAAMESDPNFAIARAMGGTEGDKKSISHFADYKKQGKQANDGEFGGYKANAKVARNAFEASQQQLKEDILDSLPERESRIRDPRDEDVAEELSDRGRAAIEAANYEFTPVDRGLGSPGYAYDPNAAIASDEAGDFMKEYKKDIQIGIGNVPGRGVMSLHNRF